MMDARRYHELPRLQIAWIDNVCMPLYSVRNEIHCFLDLKVQYEIIKI